MPITPFAFRVASAQDLEDELNTRLAPLLNIRLMGVEIDQVKQEPFSSKNIYCAYTIDAGAALLSPFQFKQVSQPTESAALSGMQQFITANPGYFFSPIFAVYRPHNPDPRQGVILGMFYSADPVAALNWGYPSGGAPSGAAGGDLYGTYPNPQVGGLRGVPILAGIPATGDQYIYDPVAGGFRVAQQYRYFVDSAAAVAAAPFINGTFVILYPGSPTSEAGTYQVSANGGAAFPADYTKVSDATDTASEVAILDAGSYFPGAGNVENALQRIGSGVISGATAALAVAVNVMDTVAILGCDGAVWEVLLENGILRYKTTLSVSHDDTNANVEEFGASPGPGVGVLPVTFDADIVAGNLRLLAIATLPGWSYRVRRLALMTV